MHLSIQCRPKGSTLKLKGLLTSHNVTLKTSAFYVPLYKRKKLQDALFVVHLCHKCQAYFRGPCYIGK